MSDSGRNIQRFCDRCRSEANMPRYAGPPVGRADEFDRELRRELDRADAAALEELWNARLTARCPRCGAHLAEQQMNGQRPSFKPLAESNGYHRFPKLDILDSDFLATADQQRLLGALLDAALNHSPADTVTAQLVEPGRGLYIAAHHGFERPFLDFFAWVTDEGSACAAAAADETIVMVPDVAHSPLYTDVSRQAMLDARSHAVQSFPLVSSTRQLLGVFSCHYHKAGRPSDDVAPLHHALAKAAAHSLQWQTKQTGNGSRVTSEPDL